MTLWIYPERELIMVHLSWTRNGSRRKKLPWSSLLHYTRRMSNKLTVSNHVIDWHGASGYSVWFIILATVLVALGFSTTGWSITEGASAVGDRGVGLWQICTCKLHQDLDDWMKAVQVIVSAGLGCLLLSVFCGLHYMLVHFLSKRFILLVFMFFVVSGVVLLTAGLAMYGHNSKDLHYSFGLVASGVLVAGTSFLLVLYQLRTSEKCCLY